MAGNPFLQNADPQAAPPPVTPHAAPSDPAGYAAVTPHGRGPAPYDIQAPMEDLAAAVAGARQLTGGAEGADSGAGLGDLMSPRQAAAAVLLGSPQGFGSDGYDINAGFSGDAYPFGWPNDVEPDVAGP